MPSTIQALDANRVVQTVKTNDAVIAAIEAQAAGAALTQSIVTMTGSSGALVAANASRNSVTVFNADGNDIAVVSLTGGTAALDEGVPIQPGGGIRVSGVAARSAMTQIGTTGQKLTVYVE
jgi:hypothetical protein